MDFTTMVSNFKRRVLEEEKEELIELGPGPRAELAAWMKEGTYSFSELFGDESDTMRIAVPLQANAKVGGIRLFRRIVKQGWTPAFTSRTVKQKGQRRVGDLPAGWQPQDPDPRAVEEYEEEVDLPLLTMAYREMVVIPKGPRKGETTTRTKKTSLGKVVQQIGTPEDKQWWKTNQNVLRNQENVNEYFLKPYMNDFEGFSDTPPMLIVSRHPIDVARMSDHLTIHSCHSEGSAYFKCSMQDAKGHGLVTLLVKGEDYDKIEDRLNEKDPKTGEVTEIFLDDKSGLGPPDGVVPLSRLRHVRMFNKETGENFALLETKVNKYDTGPKRSPYGIDNPDFIPTMLKWTRDVQKDKWADEDGNIKSDFLDPDSWARVGGEYNDTEYYKGEIGDLVEFLFKGTEQEAAASEFGGISYAYEDIDKEEGVLTAEMAEEILGNIQRAIPNTRGIFEMNIDNYGRGPDGTASWWPNVWYTTKFYFEFDDAWTGTPRHRMPEPGDTHADKRAFERILSSGFRPATTGPVPDDWDYKELPAGYRTGGGASQLIVTYSIEFDPVLPIGQRANEATLMLLRTWVNDMLREVELQYDGIHASMRSTLIKHDYLPAGAYESAVEELTDIELEHLEVIYDPEDPAAGIAVRFKQDASLRGRTQDSKYYRHIASFPRVDQHGRRVGAHFSDAIRRRPNPTYLIQQIINQWQVERRAHPQLPLGPDYKIKKERIFKDLPEDSFTSQMVLLRTPYKAPPVDAGGKELSHSDRRAFELANEPPLDVGLRIDLNIKTSVTQREYKKIRRFLDYLDKKMGEFMKAAIEVAEDTYKVASKAAAATHRLARDRRQPTPEETAELDRLAARALRGTMGEPVPAGSVGLTPTAREQALQARRRAGAVGREDLGGIPTRRSGVASVDARAREEEEEAARARAAAEADPDADVFEGKIREAIRKVIRKHVLKEEVGFETRLFQISLTLQIDKSTGGGIEQKLNRIRSIQGVTVVGHEEGENLGGKSVIVARVKFHPESDSLRPYSYINQILVPDINSSKSVPGVRVIEVIKGTLKRLDK